jgi:hypothetical protein
MLNKDKKETPKRIIKGSSLKFKKPKAEDQKNFDIFLGVEEKEETKTDKEE